MFDLVFEQLMGLDIIYTQNLQEASACDKALINYSNASINNALQIIPHALLFEDDIKPQDIRMFDWNGIPAFFKVSEALVPFDLFAASFYLITRYEEYLITQRDAHGRFCAENSLAFKEGFLRKPIVNIWIKRLAEILQKQYPAIEIKEPEYQFIPTIDIDVAFAFKHRTLSRNLLACCKDISRFDFQNIAHRIKVLSGLVPDPFDTYSIMDECHKNTNVQPVYFILNGTYNKYDLNLRLKDIAFLVQKFMKTGIVGIHPSYYSNYSLEKLRKEIESLSKTTGDKIRYSRQHYLKLNIPETYENLVSMGVEMDFTMGYATQPGFRAGIASPYPFFNLRKNVTEPLTIYPFTVMDGTLNEYMKVSKDEALAITRNLINEVKAVKGTFITIWHNSSFNQLNHWHDWHNIYKAIVDYSL